MVRMSGRSLDLLIAFASGGLLTLMVLFNGEMGRATTAFFASWAAHATGTVAALIALALLTARTGIRHSTAARAPLWSYLAGLSGAVTVMLTSATVNSPLALSGTLALGLAGQAGFALLSDRFGWFGMPVRMPRRDDLAALGLILAGSVLVIFAAGP